MNGETLWPQNAVTPPTAQWTVAPSQAAGVTPSVDGETASPSMPFCVGTTAGDSSMSSPESGAHALIRRLIDQVSWRISLLSVLADRGQISSLEARHQAEMLKHDAESVMSLLAEIPVSVRKEKK